MFAWLLACVLVCARACVFVCCCVVVFWHRKSASCGNYRWVKRFHRFVEIALLTFKTSSSSPWNAPQRNAIARRLPGTGSGKPSSLLKRTDFDRVHKFYAILLLNMDWDHLYNVAVSGKAHTIAQRTETSGIAPVRWLLYACSNDISCGASARFGLSKPT